MSLRNAYRSSTSSSPSPGNGLLRVVLPASALTVGIFSLLPLIRTVSTAERSDELIVRSVEIIPLPPPPPLPEPEEPPPEPPPETPTLPVPVPELDPPAQPPRPLETLPLAMDFAMTDLAGDFTIDFQIEPGIAPPADLRTPQPPAPPPETGTPDTPPRPILQEEPVFPRAAYSRRIEGYADMEFTVRTDGTTEDIRVVNAEPKGFFESASQRAVRRWRFEPARRNGKPVAARMQVRLRFEIQ